MRDGARRMRVSHFPAPPGPFQRSGESGDALITWSGPRRKPSPRVETLRKLLLWAQRRPAVLSSPQAMRDWLLAKPALTLTGDEVDALAAALYGAENDLLVDYMVDLELGARNVLPNDFGSTDWRPAWPAKDLAKVLASHPFAIECSRLRRMLMELLQGNGMNSAPKTTSTERKALLRALERGQRLVAGESYKRIERAQAIWREATALRKEGQGEIAAVAALATRLGMKENMVRKNVSLGRRMAGQAVRPVGLKRKRRP